MNILKKAYCRIYQAAFRVAIPLLPYREPQILHSCRELPEARKIPSLAVREAPVKVVSAVA